MEVRELGEFGLIERIGRLAGLERSASGAGVVLGIGDDAALLRPRAGHDVVVSADAFVEGVHFRFDHETPRLAGSRAAVAALSDLAAMGALPLGLTLSLSVPPRAETRVVLGLVRGLVEQAGQHGAPLIGGNVARSRSLELHLTALGEVARGKALRRHRARLGDRLFVSGPLGRSALERARGRIRHLPEPRLALGQALARSRRVSACIDLSDGLIADLGHLCAASGVGARLDASAVPRPRGFAAACRRSGADPQRLVLSGGEDYELLFALRGAQDVPVSIRRLAGPQLACVGRLAAGPLELVGTAGRMPPQPGWRHF